MEVAPSALGAQEKTQVQLGLPGAWATDRNELSDHFTTKIGGYPDWPASVQHSLVRDELLKCAVCGGWQGLVAQVHAPLALTRTKQQLNDRTIYVFGCPAQGCGVDPACWRTIRVQKELSTETDLEVATEGTNFALSVHSQSCIETSAYHEPSDWWAEGDKSWGGESLGGDASATQNSEEFLNLNELAAALMEVGTLAADNSHELPPSNRGNGPGRGIRGGSGQQITTASICESCKFPLPVLPCFYIYFSGELESHEKASPSPLSLPAHALQATKSPTEEGGDKGMELWEGEGYEPDRAIFVDKTYLRFKKHLDLSPEQCFRYCFGGQVLWAAEDEVSVVLGKCRGCGGPRVYEMQLMPPLLYFLQEALKRDFSSTPDLLDEWDWSTLIVATCAQSCSPKPGKSTVLGEDERGWCVVEEATILQQEARRICAADLAIQSNKDH